MVQKRFPSNTRGRNKQEKNKKNEQQYFFSPRACQKTVSWNLAPRRLSRLPVVPAGTYTLYVYVFTNTHSSRDLCVCVYISTITMCMCAWTNMYSKTLKYHDLYYSCVYVYVYANTYICIYLIVCILIYLCQCPSLSADAC